MMYNVGVSRHVDFTSTGIARATSGRMLDGCGTRRDPIGQRDFGARPNSVSTHNQMNCAFTLTQPRNDPLL
jgi:hypothetical protein